MEPAAARARQRAGERRAAMDMPPERDGRTASSLTRAPRAAARRLCAMPAFTKVNLMDLDDVVGDRAPGIEGRFSRSHLDSRDLGISHWRYGAGVRSTVGHRHREQEEAYLVIGGSGRMVLDGEVVDLRRWDVVRVAPEVVRAFEAGDDG